MLSHPATPTPAPALGSPATHGSWGVTVFLLALLLVALLALVLPLNRPSSSSSHSTSPPASTRSETAATKTQAQTTTGSKPTITSVTFPTQIPADGRKISGTVGFRDPDGDLSHIRLEAIEGRFNPFGFDPAMSGRTSGTIGFYIYCGTPQLVRLSVRLWDRYGHVSDPFYFSFRCT